MWSNRCVFTCVILASSISPLGSTSSTTSRETSTTTFFFIASLRPSSSSTMTLTRWVVLTLIVPHRATWCFLVTTLSLDPQSARTSYPIQMDNGVAEVCWLHYILQELHNHGLPLHNSVQHQCTKHIEIDLYFICGCVAIEYVHIRHISTTS
jgi:hypothetical protein